MLSFWGAEISLFESPDHPPQFFLCVCLSFLHSFASLVNSIPGVLQEWGSPQPIVQAGYKVNYTFNSFFKRSHTNTYTYSHIQIHTGIQKKPSNFPKLPQILRRNKVTLIIRNTISAWLSLNEYETCKSLTISQLPWCVWRFLLWDSSAGHWFCPAPLGTIITRPVRKRQGVARGVEDPKSKVTSLSTANEPLPEQMQTLTCPLYPT